MFKKNRGSTSGTKFYQKKWFWIIVIVLVVAGAFGGGSSSDDDTTSKEDNKTEEKVEKKEEVKEKTYKMNQTVKVGDVEYKVLSKKVTKKLGSKYSKHTAQEQYLVLEIAIKNLDKEALTVSESFFKLYNGENEYETSSDGIYLDNCIFFKKVNPGVTLKGQIAFDIPKEIAESKETSLQVQTGVWGTETEKIKLVK